MSMLHIISLTCQLGPNMRERVQTRAVIEKLRMVDGLHVPEAPIEDNLDSDNPKVDLQSHGCQTMVRPC